MDYTESEDRKTVTVQAPMMRTPTDYLIEGAAGFHYCKILSPFRVLEWMYTDSLFAFNGINNSTESDDIAIDFFLQ